jgi:CheY-like chemotaxis protein
MTADTKKVLVVDDESISLMLLEHFFKSLGYEATLAKDGEEALILFEKKTFSYVVMDLNMPKMNGLLTVKAIREIEKIKHQKPTFIIGLTAEQSFEQRQAGLLVGMNVVHTKPITMDALKDTLSIGVQYRDN